MSSKQPTNTEALQIKIISDPLVLMSPPYREIIFQDALLLNNGNGVNSTPNQSNRVLALIFMYRDKPIAGIAGFFKDANTGFEITSWAVQRNLLNNGLGQKILYLLECELRKHQIYYLAISFSNNLRNKAVIKHILAKQNWLEPQIGMLLCKIEVKNHTLPKWFKSILIKPGSEVFPWIALTPDEKDYLKTQLNRKKIPQELSPFKLEHKIHPEMSFGLRREGEVVGWIIAHRIRKDLLEYSALWTKPQNRSFGDGFLLIKFAVEAQLISNIEKAVFQVRTIDKAMIRAVTNRLSSLIVSQSSLWTSRKFYS